MTQLKDMARISVVAIRIMVVVVMVAPGGDLPFRCAVVPKSVESAPMRAAARSWSADILAVAPVSEHKRAISY